MNAAEIIHNESVSSQKIGCDVIQIAVVVCCLVLALVALFAHRTDARAAVDK